MNFLEAQRILAGFAGGPPLSIRLMASGTVETLFLYIRAAAAKRGRSAEVSSLPFGTLSQALFEPSLPGAIEVLLLTPWDLVPECDWRSGIPVNIATSEVMLESACQVAARIQGRHSRIVYVPAALPPLYADPRANASLAAGLSARAAALGATVVDPAWFALGSYLSHGSAIGGTHAGAIAEVVIDISLKALESSAKVLVTDLDNVLWAGLAAEEGPEGIQCGPENVGFRHFLFQSLLRRLKATGVLLAAVSRNDAEVARAPIAAGKTLLALDDFVAVLASYESKSSHIRRLAAVLNLGLDAFVFVDDNPIELAEVQAALPAVTCMRFPEHDDDLPRFMHEVSLLFARHTVTTEDRQRTEMYRRRLAAAVDLNIEARGADLSVFLAGLKMQLTIFDRSAGDRARAVQLINKTNQFNLNGRRFTDEDVSAVLSAGGHLYSVKLDDRTGGHGEILACLIDADHRVVALVLSCRVFQRRVEHAFLCWLVRRVGGDIRFAYTPTERNTPLREFLADPAFVVHERGDSLLHSERFLSDHVRDVELFRLTEPSA